jgi:hypothetical protein
MQQLSLDIQFDTLLLLFGTFWFSDCLDLTRLDSQPGRGVGVRAETDSSAAALAMLKCIGLSKRRRKKDGKRSNFIKHS